jgi:hypothetical protein
MAGGCGAKMRKQNILFIFSLFCIFISCAEYRYWDPEDVGANNINTDEIAHTPVMSSYLAEIMPSLLLDGDAFVTQFGIFMDIDAWDHKIYPDREIVAQMNGYGALLVRFHEAIALQGFAGVIGTVPKTEKLFGGGLSVHGDFGYIGVFAGYHSTEIYQFDENENPIDSLKNGSVHWNITPSINAREYPVLNLVLDKLSGYLNLNQNDFKPEYKILADFRNISLGDIWSFSFGAFTKKDWYNAEVKSTRYGGGITFHYNEYSYEPLDFITIQGGYQQFFDIANNKDIYKNGFFARLAINPFALWFDSDIFKWFIFLESDTLNWPLPKMGFFMNIGIGNLSAFKAGGHYSQLKDMERINAGGYVDAKLRWSSLLDY